MFSVSLLRLSSVVRQRKRMAWRPWNTTSASCFREWPRIPRGKLSPLIVTRTTLSSISIMETSASSVNRTWSKWQSCIHSANVLFYLFTLFQTCTQVNVLSQSVWISESDDGETVWSGQQLQETFRSWIQGHQGSLQYGWKRGANSGPG